METIRDEVVRIVMDKLSVAEEQVTDEASFAENLNADSLDLVELIMALEEEFAVDGKRMEISDEEAGNLHTVGDVVTYIEQRLKAEAAAT